MSSITRRALSIWSFAFALSAILIALEESASAASSSESFSASSAVSTADLDARTPFDLRSTNQPKASDEARICVFVPPFDLPGADVSQTSCTSCASLAPPFLFE